MAKSKRDAKRDNDKADPESTKKQKTGEESELVRKQKEMRKAALEELEKGDIEDPRMKVDEKDPKPSEDDIAKFFKKMEEINEEREGCITDEAMDMIKKFPSLLNTKHDGEFITEWLCEQTEGGPGKRDVLYELIELGAEVTPECFYSVIDMSDCEPLYEFLECLMMSGKLETIHKNESLKTLDFLAEQESYEEQSYDDPNFINLFFGRAKPEDQYSCGPIIPFFVQQTLKNLPYLEEGVTHEKGGPFAEILNRYLEEYPLE
ncbi:predicted protein [Chaetoceros tenuissimus]|uniref:Uncharacterized protein n=1 Tax=Chaetoceros tenuissimus TaxID=426638 RepID=A0AAD3GYA0_9STRA|nr:predicted protein [Chaetoceros tenuissimus]